MHLARHCAESPSHRTDKIRISRHSTSHGALHIASETEGKKKKRTLRSFWADVPGMYVHTFIHTYILALQVTLNRLSCRSNCRYVYVYTHIHTGYIKLTYCALISKQPSPSDLIQPRHLQHIYTPYQNSIAWQLSLTVSGWLPDQKIRNQLHARIVCMGKMEKEKRSDRCNTRYATKGIINGPSNFSPFLFFPVLPKRIIHVSERGSIARD